jgi:hypothetical protein
MIWSFGCSWSCGQPWTTASSDHARRRSGAWTVQAQSGSFQRVGLVARLPVGAPFPGSDPAPARDPASRVVPRGDAVEVNRIDT